MAGLSNLVYFGQFRDLGGAVYNIKHSNYGAVGDGVAGVGTNDTTAFDTAIAAMSAGDVLLIPPSTGTYLVDSVTLTKPITIIAHGATVQKKTSGTTTTHLFQDLTGAAGGTRVIGGTFDMLKSGYTIGASTVSAFHFIDATGLYFEGCTFQNSAEEGLKLYGCQEVQVRGCKFKNIANNGIQVHTPASVVSQDSSQILIVGNHFEDIDDGLAGTADGEGLTFNSTDTTYTTRDCLVVGNTFVRCIRGIWAEFGGGAGRLPGKNIAIVGNTVRDSDYYGIGMVGVEGYTIMGNTVENTGVGEPTSGTSSETTGIVISGDAFSTGGYGTCTGNTVRDDRTSAEYMEFGIRVKQGTRHVVKDNIVSGQQGNTSSYATTGETEVTQSYADLHVAWGSVTASEIVRPTKPMVKTDDAGTQVISTATDTDISWSTVEYDTDNFHDGTDTDTLDVETPQRARITGRLKWPSNSTGYRRATIAVGGAALAYDTRVAVNGDVTVNTVTVETELDNGDGVKLLGYQDSGGNLTLTLSDPENYLSIEYLGAAGT